jgi:hypothetical protein
MQSNHFFIHKQQVTVLVIQLSIRAKSRIKWCPLKGTQCVKEQKRYRKLGIRYILLGPLISWVTYGHVGLNESLHPQTKNALFLLITSDVTERCDLVVFRFRAKAFYVRHRDASQT